MSGRPNHAPTPARAKNPEGVPPIPNGGDEALANWLRDHWPEVADLLIAGPAHLGMSSLARVLSTFYDLNQRDGSYFERIGPAGTMLLLERFRAWQITNDEEWGAMYGPGGTRVELARKIREKHANERGLH